ncbi:MAG TPA: ribonuclease R [Chitinophagales bacterium]|nr:ribonuclease R [Chitinophagales bacterium]
MSKKKKEKKHKKDKEKDRESKPKPGSQPEDAVQRVFGTIKAISSDANLKRLFRKLEDKLAQEDIVMALQELEYKGKIQVQQKGRIKILEEKKPVVTPKGGKYLYGIVDITRNGSAYVDVEGRDKDIFIPRKMVHNAMQGDEVKIRLTQAFGRPEGEIVGIVRRAQDSFTGRLEVLDKFAFFIADERKLSSDVFIPLSALNGAKNNDRVIVRIMDWNTGNRNPLGEVVEVMSEKHSTDLDMKMILIGNGFSIDFPQAVYKELDVYNDVIDKAEVAKRLDYRDVLTFTIDPEDAKDFDDAISFRKLKNGNYEIGVHIADVSHYVREGSELDREAEKRATSVYLPDRVCPMLPEKLSNQLCSLRPNEDKLTFSTLFEIDTKFNIKHYSIAKTVIHSKRRFTYEEAQQVLETGAGDYAEELVLLNDIAKDIRAKRMKKGAIAFEKAEVRFKLDETGKPMGIVLKIRKDAHLLVEDFMLLANETVAKFGSKLRIGKKSVPFVYRVHDKPDPAKLEIFSTVASRFGYHIRFDDPSHASHVFNTLLKKVVGRPEQDVLETMAIRSMAKAEYTTNNIGHYGLAMEYYTHFTSPIRRYPDVLVHRLLNETLEGSDKIIDKEELEGRCKNSSLMERKAMDAEREAIKYKQIEFLQDKIGQEFDGIISGVIARGIFVEMTDNKCEGMVSAELMGHEDFMFEEKHMRLVGTRSRKKFAMGDKVRVKVLSADIILRRIDLGLVEEAVLTPSVP